LLHRSRAETWLARLTLREEMQQSGRLQEKAQSLYYTDRPYEGVLSLFPAAGTGHPQWAPPSGREVQKKSSDQAVSKKLGRRAHSGPTRCAKFRWPLRLFYEIIVGATQGRDCRVSHPGRKSKYPGNFEQAVLQMVERWRASVRTRWQSALGPHQRPIRKTIVLVHDAVPPVGYGPKSLAMWIEGPRTKHGAAHRGAGPAVGHGETSGTKPRDRRTHQGHHPLAQSICEWRKPHRAFRYPILKKAF